MDIIQKPADRAKKNKKKKEDSIFHLFDFHFRSLKNVN